MVAVRLTRCITAASTFPIGPKARCPCVSSGSWPCWRWLPSFLPSHSRKPSSTGVVKDASGAVLPGVTVEAASPALIEKVAHAPSPTARGQYRIEDLRPGTYTRHVLAAGLQHVQARRHRADRLVHRDDQRRPQGRRARGDDHRHRRDAGRRRAERAARDDAEQRRRQVDSDRAQLQRDGRRSCPASSTNLNDVVTGTATTQFPIHGGRNNEGRLTVDGLNIGNPPGGNQPPAYIADVGNAQEVTFTTSGGLGESETAGLVMNIVPKTGGNTMSAARCSSAAPARSCSRTTSRRSSRPPGLAAPTPLTKVYDLNGAFGGPIKQDRSLVLRQRAHAGQHAHHRRTCSTT